MQKAIKVVEVVSGNKGRIDLIHTNVDGSTYKQGVNDKVGTLATKLDTDSLTVLKGLSAGSIATITLTKEGNFWNLTKVENGSVAAAPKPAFQKKEWSKAPAEGRLSDIQKGEGQQRGNVLTNAVQLVVGAGNVNLATATKTVEKIARELLAVSKRLENDHPEAVVNQEQQHAQAVSDDEFFG